MNQSTAKRLRRLVRATSTDPKTDIARYDRLKRDWIKLPWNQRETLVLQLESVAQEMRGMKHVQPWTGPAYPHIRVAFPVPETLVTAPMSGKTHLAVQA